MNSVEIVTQPPEVPNYNAEETALKKLQNLVKQNPSPELDEAEHEHHHRRHHNRHEDLTEEEKKLKFDAKLKRKKEKAEERKNLPQCPNPTADQLNSTDKNDNKDRITSSTTTDEKKEDYSNISTDPSSSEDEDANYDEDGFEIPEGKIPIDGHFSTKEVEQLIEIAKKEGFLKDEVNIKVLESSDLLGDKIVMTEDDKKKAKSMSEQEKMQENQNSKKKDEQNAKEKEDTKDSMPKEI